jgi:hypothetical protein
LEPLEGVFLTVLLEFALFGALALEHARSGAIASSKNHTGLTLTILAIMGEEFARILRMFPIVVSARQIAPEWPKTYARRTAMRSAACDLAARNAASKFGADVAGMASIRASSATRSSL